MDFIKKSAETNIDDLKEYFEKDIQFGHLYCRVLLVLDDKSYLWHWGIGYDDHQLIDCNDERGDQSIRVISYEEFADGRSVFSLARESYEGFNHEKLSHRLPRVLHISSTRKIMKEALAMRVPYSLGTFNCGMVAFFLAVPGIRETFKEIRMVHPTIGQTGTTKIASIIGFVGIVFKSSVVAQISGIGIAGFNSALRFLAKDGSSVGMKDIHDALIKA